MYLHQANMRIIETIRNQLHQPVEKIPHNIERLGNTSSATIPILLDELNKSRKLKNGDTIMLSGFGAGFTSRNMSFYLDHELIIYENNTKQNMWIDRHYASHFQGSMAWVSEAYLAAAVSNAGGLDLISAMNAEAGYLREQIRLCKELTDKPFWG